MAFFRSRGGTLECRRKVEFRCGNHHGPKEAAAMWWGELENLSGREKTGVKFEEAEGELGETSSTEAKERSDVYKKNVS